MLVRKFVPKANHLEKIVNKRLAFRDFIHALNRGSIVRCFSGLRRDKESEREVAKIKEKIKNNSAIQCFW
jgi:hypothetical protein